MMATFNSWPFGVVYEHSSSTRLPAMALPSADSGVMVAAPEYCSSCEPR